MYSKSENHLLLQLQIKNRLPPGEAQIEQPLFSINRVADVLWKTKKIIFEVQCSPIQIPEIEARVIEYRTLGYDLVWILDDKIFNRRIVQSSELLLRKRHWCYFAGKYIGFYDQFELFSGQTRTKKGRPTPIDIRRVYLIPPRSFDPLIEEGLPQQIAIRLQHCPRCFEKDLMQRSLHPYPSFTHVLQKWKTLEQEIRISNGRVQANAKPDKWFGYILKQFLSLSGSLLNRFLERLDQM